MTIRDSRLDKIAETLTAKERGLLVLRAGDAAIRMAPPLVLDRARAETGLRIFDEACQDVDGAA